MSHAQSSTPIASPAEAVQHDAGATIGVKNADGGIVILAGVATALATKERHRRQTRPPRYLEGARAKISGSRTLTAGLARD